MSMKKWRQLVNEKAEVEQQNESILAAIKNNKINEELGQLSGEKLFKPITSRLDRRQEGPAPEEQVPDYGMDELDLINPFDGDFRPDEETPTPSPSPTPSPTPPSPASTPPPSPTWGEPHTPESTPLPPLAEEEETELLEESGATPTPQPSKSGSKWESPKPPGIKGSESVDLQTLNSMLSKNKDNPDYVVKSKKSKFHGYSMSDIKAARDEILDRRKGNKQPRAPLPKGVEELDREMEGSGGAWGISNSVATHSVDPNALVEQLHLSLASIRAGNTSLKLKKQVEFMLGFLEAAGEITEKESHNILRSII